VGVHRDRDVRVPETLLHNLRMHTRRGSLRAAVKGPEIEENSLPVKDDEFVRRFYENGGNATHAARDAGDSPRWDIADRLRPEAAS
jgi:hypothetical protein